MAYGHVPTQLITKLDDRSKRYIFISYDEEAKAYKLYNPGTCKVLVSQDVQVNEESEWNWEDSKERSLGSTTSGGESSEITVRSQEITNESVEDDESVQPKTRSLQDIYNSIDEVHVVCLLAGEEDIKFEEAVLDERWKKAMDEEIGSIEKNETWELTDLPTRARPIGVK